MTLEAENTRLRTENEELKKQLVYISHELDQLKKMVFGRRSERSKTLYYDNGQQSLFEDDELPAEEEPKKVKTHIRQKVKTGNKPKRIIFPADLPREDQILNPEGIEEDRYEKIGEDITEILAYQPGNIFVKRIIRPRWAKKRRKIRRTPKNDLTGEYSSAFDLQRI